MKKFKAFVLVAITAVSSLFASTISFSGGYTKVSLANGSKTVNLTGHAIIKTDDFKLESDSVRLYGDSYNFVQCNGNVKATQEKRKLTLLTPWLFNDRAKNIIRTDGWTEIEDLSNEAKISCSRLEYNTETEVMKLETEVRIEKNTSDGLMVCTADLITFDNISQTLVLKGQSRIVWGENTYSAAIITVDLNTEEVVMSGSVSGEING